MFHTAGTETSSKIAASSERSLLLEKHRSLNTYGFNALQCKEHLLHAGTNPCPFTVPKLLIA